MDTLPPELLQLVVKRINTITAAGRFASTCQTWRAAADAAGDGLWRKVASGMKLASDYKQFVRAGLPLRPQLQALYALNECKTQGEWRKPTPHYTFEVWHSDIEDELDEELISRDDHSQHAGTLDAYEWPGKLQHFVGGAVESRLSDYSWKIELHIDRFSKSTPNCWSLSPNVRSYMGVFNNLDELGSIPLYDSSHVPSAIRMGCLDRPDFDWESLRLRIIVSRGHRAARIFDGRLYEEMDFKVQNLGMHMPSDPDDDFYEDIDYLSLHARLNEDLETRCRLELTFTRDSEAQMPTQTLLELLEYRLHYECDKPQRARRYEEAKRAAEARAAEERARAEAKRLAQEKKATRMRKELGLPEKPAKKFKNGWRPDGTWGPVGNGYYPGAGSAR